jgi:putative ABC transport system permease protein
MYRIGLKMLTEDKAKYIGMILSISFSALIITQQMAIFIGLMRRSYSFIMDTPQARIWVMNPSVKMIDDVNNVREIELMRIRSIKGVKWAMPFFKGLISARLSNGQFQTCNLLGIDSGTFIGAPHTMIEGSVEDLRKPFSVIVDLEATLDKLAQDQGEGKPKKPLRVGDELELNDRRARVVGICKLTKGFWSYPCIYTTYKNATFYTPYERKELSFIVAESDGTVSEEELCQRIAQQTQLKAYTKEQFEGVTVHYYLKNTGIPISFGIAVSLGILIGMAIMGQIFFNFTTDNLKYLALFTVVGASRRLLATITLLQALWVGLIGWGVGTGMAACIGFFTEQTLLAFFLPWQLLLGTGVLMLLLCIGASVLSIIRIYRLDLSMVYRQ